MCVDNQFFLACIARRTAVVSKSQASQSIAQFDTKQDVLGKILVVDTGYACRRLRSLYTEICQHLLTAVGCGYEH